MLPETFWGRIQYLLQQYGSSFLSGAGNTMIIAIVGTFLGCLIGFIVGIIQTIPVCRCYGRDDEPQFSGTVKHWGEG